ATGSASTRVARILGNLPALRPSAGRSPPGSLAGPPTRLSATGARAALRRLTTRGAGVQARPQRRGRGAAGRRARTAPGRGGLPRPGRGGGGARRGDAGARRARGRGGRAGGRRRERGG